MNKWVSKSLRLARSKGYLDELSQIYPSEIPPQRPLSKEERQAIQSYYEKKDWLTLLKALFALTKINHPFPIEHPYASLMRQIPELIDINPRICQQLGEALLSMPVQQLVAGCERPIDINRRMGPVFRKWLKQYFTSQGYKFLQEHGFDSTDTSFLDAADTSILNYINRKLGIKTTRGRDLLAKIKGKHVVGEARFLSTSGGSQTRDLVETISFIKSTKKTVVAVGVVDGIVWFDKKYIGMLSALEEDEPVLTALLLQDFLENLS
jgi:hypothetical protein